MFYFLLTFCRKMIKVVCTILIIVIEDLELCLPNLNLLLGKNAIGFELLAQKRKTGKQIANTLYY